MALLRLISKYVFVYNHFIIAALVASLIEQSLPLHYLSKLFLSSFPEAKGFNTTEARTLKVHIPNIKITSETFLFVLFAYYLAFHITLFLNIY